MDKALIKIPSKYADFANVFLLKLVINLFKHIRINNHAIELVDDQQLPSDPIYSLGPVELEILKIYIKNNLTNGFIRLSKSFTRASIFFDKKSDRSLRLRVNYQGFNNLIIKNWYLLFLVDKSLDQQGQAWRFTLFDLANIYHRIWIKKGDKLKMAFRTCYGHFKY